MKTPEDLFDDWCTRYGLSNTIGRRQLWLAGYYTALTASTSTSPLTSAEINALPDRVRRWIHDLETRADPAGTLQDNFALRENVAYLQQRLVVP